MRHRTLGIAPRYDVCAFAIYGKWFVDNSKWQQPGSGRAVGVARIVPQQETLMAKKSSGGGGSYRSAITGRYVTAKHGKASPRTTVKEKR